MAETTRREKETVLEQAESIVNGSRIKDYSHPLDNFTKIAAGWSQILEVEVTPEQVGLCMIWLKVARQSWRSKEDNLVDIAGYTRTLEMIEEERERRALASAPHADRIAAHIQEIEADRREALEQVNQRHDNCCPV